MTPDLKLYSVPTTSASEASSSSEIFLRCFASNTARNEMRSLHMLPDGRLSYLHLSAGELQTPQRIFCPGSQHVADYDCTLDSKVCTLRFITAPTSSAISSMA